MNMAWMWGYLVAVTLLGLAASVWMEYRLAVTVAQPFAEAYRRTVQGFRTGLLISSGVIGFFVYRLQAMGARLDPTPLPWSSLTALTQAHIVSAVLALVIGPFILWGRKGDARHKLLGRLWCVAMLITALSGAGMWLLGRGGGVLIVFSVITLFSLMAGIRAIRRREGETHLRCMLGAYMGLVFAACFTLMPGRIMSNWVLALFC
jgi:uncharacterized membrane protein